MGRLLAPIRYTARSQRECRALASWLRCCHVCCAVSTLPNLPVANIRYQQKFSLALFGDNPTPDRTSRQLRAL
ncbi:hypothetical protein LSAT2_019179 [Lamellibrachia satsuma]|nr:hypothetical protein LSAT2_019179 [Lamellibrachia satsuma]